MVFTLFLAACGSGKTGDSGSVAQNLKSAISQVADVVEVKARYNINTGMGSTASVRITASPGAELETVLDESLQAFAGAADSAKGATSVAYYVFTEGDEETGVHPDALGLNITPTVDEIRGYVGM